jgi:predicted  nucleic acid-binding Zn-ribbon protein
LQLKEEIKKLKDLQAVDLEIGKIESELAVGTTELDNRKEGIEKLKTDIAEHAVKLEDGENRRKELEGEVEEEQLMVKERQNKLMKVQTNREYQSILKEIEDAKNTNRQREDELVRLMEQAEILQTKKDEQTALCKEEEGQYKEESARLESEAVTLTAKLEKAQKKRTTKAKKVKAADLRMYDRIRQNRGGVAMVGVSKGVCSGCFMNVPPQLFNELLREDQLHACPACNRLMYNVPDAE